MKIIQTAKNGTVTRAIKTYDELTDDEKDWLASYRYIGTAEQEKKMLVDGSHFEERPDEYLTFDVAHYKNGEVCFVEPKQLSENGEQRREERNSEPNIFDFMNVLLGNNHSKAYRKSRKKFNASTKDINNARKIMRGKN